MNRRLALFVAMLSFAVVAAFVAIAWSSRANAADAPAAPATVVKLGNAICPVTGAAIKPGVVVVWQGVEIGLGCDDCPARFSAHPEAYAPALLREMAGQVAALKARLPAAPASAPVAVAPVEIGNKTCPVMGRPVRTGLFVEYHGMNIGLCCPGCHFKLLENPDKFLPVLRQDADVAKKMDAAEAAWRAAQPR